MKQLKRLLSVLLTAAILAGAIALLPSCTLTGGDKSSGSESSVDTSAASGDTSSGALLSEPEVDPETQALYDTVVMTIGDYTVTYETYRYYFLTGMRNYDGGDPSFWKTSAGAEAMEHLKNEIIDEMRYNAALYTLCKQQNISLTDEELQEIDESIESTAAQMQMFYGTTMTEMLSSYNMTMKFYKDLSCNNALADKLYEAFSDPEAGNMDFSEDAVKSYSEGFFHVKHILYEASGSSSSDTEAKAKAEAAIAALAAIENQTERFDKFDELIKSDSADYHEGRDNFYYYQHGEMVSEFEEAVDALAENEISGAVKSQFGYHVILRLPLDLSYFKEKVYPGYKFNSTLQESGSTLEMTTTQFYAALTPENAA